MFGPLKRVVVIADHYQFGRNAIVANLNLVNGRHRVVIAKDDSVAQKQRPSNLDGRLVIKDTMLAK